MGSVTAENQQAVMNAVVNLAKTCDYDATHTLQVTRLALHLFDQLESLHHLGPEDRFWLECAGLLHDIGWIDGGKEHHKASLNIILTTPLLPFSSKERLIVGSIARYHRKALPDPRHDHFAALNTEEKEKVRKLAALLRLADGLDSSHLARVRYLKCRIRPKKVIVECTAAQEAMEEADAAADKSDLFQQVFQKKIDIKWKSLKDR